MPLLCCLTAGAGTVKQTDCSTICSNRFDLLCAAKNRCWSNVGGFFGLMLGTIAGAGLLFFAFKMGWINMLFQACGCFPSCCFGGGSSSHSKKGKHDRHKMSKYDVYDDDRDELSYKRQRNSQKVGRNSRRSEGFAVDDYQAQHQERWRQGQHDSQTNVQAGGRSVGHSLGDVGLNRHSSSGGLWDGGSEFLAPGDLHNAPHGGIRSDGIGGKKRASSSAGSSNPTKWITAAPWDESASGGAGYIPAGRAGHSSGRPRGRYSVEQEGDAQEQFGDGLFEEGEPHPGLHTDVVLSTSTAWSMLTADIPCADSQPQPSHSNHAACFDHKITCLTESVWYQQG